MLICISWEHTHFHQYTPLHTGGKQHCSLHIIISCSSKYRLLKRPCSCSNQCSWPNDTASSDIPGDRQCLMDQIGRHLSGEQTHIDEKMVEVRTLPISSVIAA